MDKDFFVDQLDAHGDMLYRVAYSMLHNDDDCKDALQETALKAWEKRGTLREQSYFRTWITRILINTCYDTQRKRKRTVFLEEAPELASPPPDPTLAAALDALPEKLRLPLVLCCVEGMSYAELCEQIVLLSLRDRKRN